MAGGFEGYINDLVSDSFLSYIMEGNGTGECLGILNRHMDPAIGIDAAREVNPYERARSHALAWERRMDAPSVSPLLAAIVYALGSGDRVETPPAPEPKPVTVDDLYAAYESCRPKPPSLFVTPEVGALAAEVGFTQGVHYEVAPYLPDGVNAVKINQDMIDEAMNQGPWHEFR